MLTQSQGIPTALFTQFGERPYFALKMHANELNAEKIERGTKENGSYLITIFKKTNEKV